MNINKIQASALNRTAEEAFKTFVSYLFKNGTETKVPSLNNTKYLFYKIDLNNAASKIAIERWRQRGRLVEAGKDDHQMVLEIPHSHRRPSPRLLAGCAEPDIPQQ